MLFIPGGSQSRIFSPLLVSLFILIIFTHFAMFCLVQEFLSRLTRQDIEYLLRNVLAMGRGSLDFAKKLLDEKNAPPPPPPSPGNNSFPEWCRCGVCRPMPSDQENLCCERVDCITRFQVFNNICLDRDIFKVCIKAC